MNARVIGGCLLAVAVLLAGCQSDTQGTPTTSPESAGEPTFPTERPSRSPTAAPPTAQPRDPAPPSRARPPGGGHVLQPENGYVFVQTKSGKTRCQLNTAEVGCEAPFTSPPMVDGSPANGVRLTAGGQVQWVVGNLGAIPAVTMDYDTYHAVGWTIQAGEDGTRFTNDSSGHGMFVAIERVETF